MELLKPGEKAPPFRLASSGGKQLSLKDLQGKWVVLYFYPRDLTPGCTVEAEGFQAASARFNDRGAVVVGVSKDSVASHNQFVARCNLSFPLLSDPDAEMIKAYGAWGEKSLYGKKFQGILRTTVLVDPKGKVVKVFPKVKPAGHAEQVLAALDEARVR